MAYRLIVTFSDGRTNDDDVFDTYEEAKAGIAEWEEGWSAGAEVLADAGEPYSEAEIVDFEIVEE